MAKKKSKLSTLLWMVMTTVFGGGVSGYLKPDIPVIGPFISSVMAKREAGETIDGGDLLASAKTLANRGSASSNLPGNPAQPGNAAQPGGATQVGAQLASSRRPSTSLLVASFNIQVLGKSKMSKPAVTEVLAQVIRQFDIVAIQEVRAKEDDILPRLVAAVNALGDQYNFLIGPRLGRTVSKEQYAFVYDTSRVEYDPSCVGTMSDPSDVLHREPFAVRFRARTNSPQQAFTFWLVNIHTDPDDVPEEVAALADAFQVMQGARPDEDDVILLGDLNASEKQLGRLGQIPGMTWTVSGVMTNTRKNKAYDNILFHRTATSEYTGRWGVYDLESTFGLSRDDALKVSDHLPIWAEFQIWETPPQGNVAGRTQNQGPLLRGRR